MDFLEYFSRVIQDKIVDFFREYFRKTRLNSNEVRNLLTSTQKKKKKRRVESVQNSYSSSKSASKLGKNEQICALFLKDHRNYNWEPLETFFFFLKRY